jgi:hypothetical protein
MEGVIVAKRRWPKQTRHGVKVEAYLPEEMAAQLRQLCERTGRPLAEEVRHAVERHLAQPPHVVAPALLPVEVEQPQAAPPKKRTRSRASADS